MTQVEDCEECFGHDYEFMEPLPSSPEEFQELYRCIHCGHERVLTHQVGIRD
jgi:hypothetical protein